MKIAIVNVVGVEGSTGKIATKLAEKYGSKGVDCRIYHGRGAKQDSEIYRKYGSFSDNSVHYLMARITDCEGEYSTFYTKKLLSDLLSFNPDVIILLNLHGHYLNIPVFMDRISSTKSKVIYFLCDEFPYTSRCDYIPEECTGYLNKCEDCPLKLKNLSHQYSKKFNYYEKLGDNIGFASVGYIANRARKSSLLTGRRIYTINTGIDTDYFHPVETDSLKERLGIASDKTILINVAMYSYKRKGVEYFIEAARAFENDGRFAFVNIGYDGPSDILPSNYIAIPYVSEQDRLRDYYSLADAYICTSTMDALPNACVSAMSCGTPVVGFPVSGIPFLAEEPVLHLLDGVGSEPIIEYLKTIDKKTSDLSDKCRKYAVDNYSFDDFADKLLDAALGK